MGTGCIMDLERPVVTQRIPHHAGMDDIMYRLSAIDDATIFHLQDPIRPFGKIHVMGYDEQ